MPHGLIEHVAAAAHAAWLQAHGQQPIPWERLSARDRARWTRVAQATVTAWVLAENGVLSRRQTTEDLENDSPSP